MALFHRTTGSIMWLVLVCILYVSLLRLSVQYQCFRPQLASCSSSSSRTTPGARPTMPITRLPCPLSVKKITYPGHAQTTTCLPSLPPISPITMRSLRKRPYTPSAVCCSCKLLDSSSTWRRTRWARRCTQLGPT